MDVEEIEIKILMDALKMRYGYDFRGYASASFARRVRTFIAQAGMDKISDMIPKMLYEDSFFYSFLHFMSVNTTEMFRDPSVYLTLRQKIIPYLKTFPFIKVWIAGVATGEEVYSLAILLREEGLYDKSTIYATDFNNHALELAKMGSYPMEHVIKSTVNHKKSGGECPFSDYYNTSHDSAVFDPSLRDNVVFASHNLVTDEVFGEMNLILCRNVLIYFDAKLQERVLTLFGASLSRNGFLCIGKRETIEPFSLSGTFEPVAEKSKIYQKKNGGSKQVKS